MHIRTEVERMSFAAAHAQLAGARKVSIQQFLESQGVLVVRQDTSRDKVSKPFVRAFFERTISLINARPDIFTSPDTFIFVDELEFNGRFPGLREAAQFSREKGLALNLATQTIEGLWREYGKEDAETIAGCCPYQAYFRSESQTTASWAARKFGRGEFRESEFSRGYAEKGLSLTENQRRYERDQVYDENFLNLPFPSFENGFHCCIRSPLTGAEVDKWLAGEEIESLKPGSAKVTRCPIPLDLQLPRLWTVEERELFVFGNLRSQSAGQGSRGSGYVSPILASLEPEIREGLFDMASDVVERLVIEMLKRRDKGV
jgi:hypothetical protein